MQFQCCLSAPGRQAGQGVPVRASLVQLRLERIGPTRDRSEHINHLEKSKGVET